MKQYLLVFVLFISFISLINAQSTNWNREKFNAMCWMQGEEFDAEFETFKSSFNKCSQRGRYLRYSSDDDDDDGGIECQSCSSGKFIRENYIYIILI